jgi:hypothetical protein
MIPTQTQAPEISLEVIPEQYRKMAGPEAPARARSMVAAGLLPMPSEALVASLCYLSEDSDRELSSKAKETLLELEQDILVGIANASDSPALLHVLARCSMKRQNVLEQILVNKNADDHTFIYVAKNGKGRSLNVISHNTVRVTRTPAIAEALYYNVETPMVAVTTALEACVRNNVDISSLPGYEEIIESILGVSQVEKEELPVDEVTEGEPTEEEIAENSFNEILREAGRGASQNVDASRVTWQMLQEMTAAQKVRLALVGNASLRAQLISDARPLVSMAVLKSPKLTDKEIAAFANNKSLSDQIIRTIASRRDWVKNKSVKAALVQNPKTPARYALSFLSFLTSKELKDLRKNKEIPTYVSQAANALFQKREKRN